MSGPDATGWACPLPLRDYERIVLGHGGGGRLSADLVEHLFVPAFGPAPEHGLHDSAVLRLPAKRLAFSTDSYVVRPLFFPGGSIGELAVNGTINDLAMSGAQPVGLSCGFIIEEGLDMAVLGRVVDRMAAAARAAGVAVVTGDTKVVDRGAADQLFVNTAGIGTVSDGVDIRPDRATPGDVVIVSGEIGVHGVAVLSQREGLEFGTDIGSDTAALHRMVASILEVCPDAHVFRDPTRGGVAAALSEIASTSGVGIAYEEPLLPVPTAVAAACSFLGLDPINIANEGKMIAIVAAPSADAVVNAMAAHPGGSRATVIGRVVADHPGTVVAKTALGATRVVDLPLGEVLPRIC